MQTGRTTQRTIHKQPQNDSVRCSKVIANEGPHKLMRLLAHARANEMPVYLGVVKSLHIGSTDILKPHGTDDTASVQFKNGIRYQVTFQSCPKSRAHHV